MHRDEVPELHCIMPIANMASVMQLGILSHVRAEDLPHVSAAMEEIQDRRAAVRIPGGRRLHEYANLYFNARNAMMYKRKELHASLCVISVKPAVLDIPGTVVTDINAAADPIFQPAPEGLRIVDRDLVRAISWDHPDYYEKVRRKQGMMAEVLVPDVVPVEYINGASVSCPEGRDALQRVASECPVKDPS